MSSSGTLFKIYFYYSRDMDKDNKTRKYNKYLELWGKKSIEEKMFK